MPCPQRPSCRRARPRESCWRAVLRPGDAELLALICAPALPARACCTWRRSCGRRRGITGGGFGHGLLNTSADDLARIRAWAALANAPSWWRCWSWRAAPGPAPEGTRVFGTPGAVKHYLQLHLAARATRCLRCCSSTAEPAGGAGRAVSRNLTQTSVYRARWCCAPCTTRPPAWCWRTTTPAASVQPSCADEALTQTLKAALALVDVRVLDHVIVGAGDAPSMAEKGLL